MKIIYTLFALIALTSCQLKEPDVFGVAWGDSLSDLKSRKIELTKDSKTNGLSIYYTNSMPKSLNDIREYILFIDDDFGLQRVTAISYGINEPYSGSMSRDKYHKFYDVVVSKYKHKKEFRLEKVKALCNGNFMNCLRENKYIYADSFLTDGTNHSEIFLKLGYKGYNTTDITLTFSGKDWDNVIKKNQTLSSQSL